MNFDLTEEQLQIKYSVREFAEAEIGPHVMEWDEAQHFPKELWPKLGELGLLGVIIPGSGRILDLGVIGHHLLQYRRLPRAFPGESPARTGKCDDP